MALSGLTVWDVRTGGNDTNGGGFVTGASGTDWSQQNSPQYSVTDGVTAGTTTITSATASFGTDVVGNIMYVQGGTGSVTAGWYQIVTRTNATTIVVDRSTGLTAGTGVTLHIGGSLLTIAQAISSTNVVGGNKIYVKSGTYTITTTLTPSTNGNQGVGGFGYCLLEGYGSTHGDLGTKPLITTATNSVSILTVSATQGSAWVYRNLSMSSTAGTKGDGIISNGSVPQQIVFDRCLFDGFRRGVNFDHSPVWRCTGLSFYNTEIKNCQNGVVVSAGYFMFGCYIHGNSTFGCGVGATSDGLTAFTHIDTVFYSNGNGFDATTLNVVQGTTIYSFIGCCFTDNTNGLSLGASTSSPANIPLFNCAFYNNSGKDITWNDSSDTFVGTIMSASNAANGSNTNWPAASITLTGDPFVARTAANYATNNTAGAGAALRAAGFPGVSLVGTGYVDVGTLQASGGGGGGSTTIVTSGMDGGMRG